MKCIKARSDLPRPGLEVFRQSSVLPSVSETVTAQTPQEVELDQAQKHIPNFFAQSVFQDNHVLGLNQNSLARIRQSTVQVNLNGNLTAAGKFADNDCLRWLAETATTATITHTTATHSATHAAATTAAS